MTAAEAVGRFVRPDSVLGMGGQNIGRCPMALTHEIIRQRIGGLTVAGCNLSIAMDELVAAGLVRRTVCGTGNLERFGTTFCWRRAIEDGSLEVDDYSHLAMVTRFLAGEMGVPFMPTRSLLGSDLLDGEGRRRGSGRTGAGRSASRRPGKAAVVANPWDPRQQVVLVPALRPDVSIVHVQRADPTGNLVIDGFATHEPEMVRASHHVIASCEEIVSTDVIRQRAEQTSVPFIHVSAVVVQPFGAYPTSTYRYYDFDPDHLAAYQAAARAGPDRVRGYLEEQVWSCAAFDEHLARAAGEERLARLRTAMQAMV